MSILIDEIVVNKILQNIQSMNILIAHTDNTPLWYESSLTLYHSRSNIRIVESDPLSLLAKGRRPLEYGLWVSHSSFPPKDLSPSCEAYYCGPRM
jgi:hypothetical protein